MYALKGGAVPIPSWILIFRAFQFFFALLTLALSAYALSVYGGGPLQSPLIALIIISALTIIPILLTTPLHLAQRKIYDPRIALLLDGFALLYWIAVFAALASYHRIFKYWGLENGAYDFDFAFCGRCRRAWRTGVAATVFSAIQFILFLITTLAFIYYYHCHLAEVPAPGVSHKGNKTTETAGAAHGAGGITPANTTTTTAAGGAAGTAEQHPMGHVPASGGTGTYLGAAGHSNEAPYSTSEGVAPRQGGYGGYEEGSNAGYGADRSHA